MLLVELNINRIFIDFVENHQLVEIYSYIVLFLFMSIEFFIPLFKYNNNIFTHTLTNILFKFFRALAILLFFGLTTFNLDFVKEHHVGLLFLFDLPFWGQLIISILFIDFIAEFLSHILSHKIPFLWRAHIVHHSDRAMNSSTSFRHHPIEEMFRTVMLNMGIIMLGCSIEIVAIHHFIRVTNSLFIHSNFKLPEKLNKVLLYVIVTPNSHRAHHHYKLPYTDTNYGFIFSFWDRLFGTLTPINEKEIKYGLDILEGKAEKKDQNFWYQLILPFIVKLKK